MKNEVNVATKSNKQKKLKNKNLAAILKVTDEISKIRSRIRIQNVTDSQHCLYNTVHP